MVKLLTLLRRGKIRSSRKNLGPPFLPLYHKDACRVRALLEAQCGFAFPCRSLKHDSLHSSLGQHDKAAWSVWKSKGCLPHSLFEMQPFIGLVWKHQWPSFWRHWDTWDVVMQCWREEVHISIGSRVWHSPTPIQHWEKGSSRSYPGHTKWAWVSHAVSSGTEYRTIRKWCFEFYLMFLINLITSLYHFIFNFKTFLLIHKTLKIVHINGVPCNISIHVSIV